MDSSTHPRTTNAASRPPSVRIASARGSSGQRDTASRTAPLELDEVESVAQIGSYALDIESGRWMSSRGLDRILGIDRAYARTVEGWAALIHPDDRAEMVAYFLDQVLGQQGGFDRQYRIVRLDTGVERWVHGRGALDLDASGQPERMVGTIADVTDRRLLEAQNQRLAQALVQTDAAVLITRPTGELDFANPAFERLVGLMPGERFPDALRRLTDELLAGTRAELARTPSSGGTWSGEIAMRRGDGSVQVAEASISPILGGGGSVEGSITVARDVTERREEARERDRLAAAVEQAADGILITDREWQIVYTNPAYASSVGLVPSDLIGRTAAEVAAIGLDPATLAEMSETVRSGRRWTAQVDHRRPDGSSRRLEVDVSPTYDPGGEISSWVGVMHDITERIDAMAALTASELRLRTALDTMLDGVTVTTAIRDVNGRIVDFRFEYANAAIREISGGSCEVGRTLLERLPAHRSSGLFDAYALVVESGVPLETGAVHYVDPDATSGPLDQMVEHRVAKLGDGYVLSVRDVTARYRSELQMRRLATAIEQSADAVVIADTDARIEYVNPAFERVTGYRREEVLGQNPRILQSGEHGPAFYAAMWTTLTSGQSFTADLTNRRKDGSLFQEEAVLSPIHDDTGAITSYVAVKRDVTHERAVEAAAERAARERAMITGTLARVRAGPSAMATAESICRQVVSLAGLSTANLNYFTLEGAAMPLAFVRADAAEVPLRRFPFQRSRTLRERAGEGPWVEAWVRRPWHPYDRLFGELGVTAVAVAPIHAEGRLVGLLEVSSSDAGATSALTESLPALLEFAGFAGALVGPGIDDLTEVGSTRDRILQTIRSGAFHPVFQPIVDVTTGSPVGYEALTRFSSGVAPAVLFADARSVGLEVDLELATLTASLESARRLPSRAWLSLNVSPGLVTANRRLAGVLRQSDRAVVLEVTEHVPVGDYGELRRAIDRLRPRVRVAVDDAGSGVANFGHIVELRPAFVKLDIGLVRGIDTDRTRQALIVGLLHFARESASQTIAEGVETPEELATLRRLGVPLAQGYLLGRPAQVG